MTELEKWAERQKPVNWRDQCENLLSVIEQLRSSNYQGHAAKALVDCAIEATHYLLENEK